MRHLELYFRKEQEKSANASDHLCFLRAVKGRKFSRRLIHKQFNKLVDKDDYAKSDKKELLRQLEVFSNTPSY